MSRDVIYTHFAVRRFRLFNVEIIGHVRGCPPGKPYRSYTLSLSLSDPRSSRLFLLLLLSSCPFLSLRPRSIDNYADYDQHREPITAADRFHFHNSRRFRPPFQRATDALFLKLPTAAAATHLELPRIYITRNSASQVVFVDAFWRMFNAKISPEIAQFLIRFSFRSFVYLNVLLLIRNFIRNFDSIYFEQY